MKNNQLRDLVIVVFFLIFGAGMFWWGLESRTVENYVCVTYARQSGFLNPPFTGFSWSSNMSCSPMEKNNFSCNVGELYLYQEAVVLDNWVPRG